MDLQLGIRGSIFELSPQNFHVWLYVKIVVLPPQEYL